MNETIGANAWDELYAGFNGRIIRPEDGEYNEARRIFNAMIDRKPAVIAQCDTVEDVVRSVRFARRHNLEVAVRGGGHSVAGQSLTDGGMVIDLRRMNAVSVHCESNLATVEGGATMGHLDRATGWHGLMTTGGRVSSTGVGGFTLGGGSGWFERKYGLACDNLAGAQLVTASGEVVRASEHENTDLFWALHGGGGNFGVVTEFSFRLYPLAKVTATLLFWDPDRGDEVIRAYRSFIESAPDEVGGGAFFLTGPDEAFVPESLRNQLALMVLIAYAGPEADARRVQAPMMETRPAGCLVQEIPYPQFQCMLDDKPGYRNYWSAAHLSAMPDPAVERFCSRARDLIVPSPSQHVLFPMGGAVARGSGRFPIPWRTAAWVAHPFGLWEDPADDVRAFQWARNVRDDLEPWSNQTVYLNFIGNEGENRLVSGFGKENYEKLAKVKAMYDPGNVFHLNHNIRPARQAEMASAPA